MMLSLNTVSCLKTVLGQIFYCLGLGLEGWCLVNIPEHKVFMSSVAEMLVHACVSTSNQFDIVRVVGFYILCNATQSEIARVKEDKLIKLETVDWRSRVQPALSIQLSMVRFGYDYFVNYFAL